MSSNPRIRVLAIDDSAVFRKVLTDILGHREDIELVGCATDAYDARDRLANLPVDVLTLDLEMPRMPGLNFLKLVMERKPMPVIIVSSHTPTGSQKAVEALFSGAFSVLGKPDNHDHIAPFGERLVQDIKRAANAPIRPRRPALLNPCLSASGTLRPYDPRQIIALGASTGGTQALADVLAMLPAEMPGIVMVQHIPPVSRRASPRGWIARRPWKCAKRARAKWCGPARRCWRPATGTWRCAGSAIITAFIFTTTRRSSTSGLRLTCCSTRSRNMRDRT